MRYSLPSLCLLLIGAQATTSDGSSQHVLQDHGASSQSVSVSFFSLLERLSRIVDITYCVGNTGVSPPFSCASRCKEFPSMELVTTWNTGLLMTDSCGYIAVDHGDNKTSKDASMDVDNDQGQIVIAFRGTYSITNTVIDLSTVPQEYVPYPDPEDGDDGGNGHGQKCTNCTVHMGFLASWRSARDIVLPAIKEARAKHPTYQIQLVGHSLGGAVAALAALELRVALGLRDNELRITTFGEPRVGNQGLADFIDRAFGMDDENGSFDKDLEKRTYQRVTHVNDPVPLLPLSEWGYRSHAGEVLITKADLSPAPEDLRMCRGDADERCSAGQESAAYLRSVADVAREARALEEMGFGPPEGADAMGFPTRLKLWQLFFAHRDYFWRLGLCVPGGDPWDWGRDKYDDVVPGSDEL